MDLDWELRGRLAVFNGAVRTAMRSRLPVAYLWGIDKGWYLPLAPVEVVGDAPAGREFLLDLTELY